MSDNTHILRAIGKTDAVKPRHVVLWEDRIGGLEKQLIATSIGSAPEVVVFWPLGKAVESDDAHDKQLKF